MEFPEINMISDFEAGVKCLQNPSLISRFFSISKVPQVYSFWKWGALILAIVATFSSLIRKLKILFIYVTTLKPSAEPLLQYLGEDLDISDGEEDDDDDQCSSLMSSDDDDKDINDRKIDQDFTCAGSSFYYKEQGQGQGQNRHLRLRKQRTNSSEWFPWTEGKNVVKLWDSLALGLDFDLDLDHEFDDSIKSIVSLWDLNKEKKINNIFGGNCASPAVAVASPTVVLSNDSVLTGYDVRIKSQTPAIGAKWGNGELVGVTSDGVGKVYVKNDGCLTVGDLRNVKTPLENLTAGDSDTWWDADAVIIEDENFAG